MGLATKWCFCFQGRSDPPGAPRGYTLLTGPCSHLFGNALSGPLPKQLFSGKRALRRVDVSCESAMCLLFGCAHGTAKHFLMVPLAVQLSANAFTGTLPVEWADSLVRFHDVGQHAHRSALCQLGRLRTCESVVL